MEIILLERVEKLGQMGDVVTVKPGFARNFLLPKGKALRATKSNREAFESRRAQLEADNVKRRDEAASIAGKIEGLSVILVRSASDMGQLYGSVTTRDIAEAVTAEGCTITKNQVRLDRPIKTIGIFDVTVSLHPEVSVVIQANVARSVDEAERQAQGIDPTVEQEPEDEAEEAFAQLDDEIEVDSELLEQPEADAAEAAEETETKA